MKGEYLLIFLYHLQKLFFYSFENISHQAEIEEFDKKMQEEKEELEKQLQEDKEKKEKQVYKAAVTIQAAYRSYR